MMTGEHFTNFFLENMPQIAVGLGDGHPGAAGEVAEGPEEDGARRDAGLAAHITAGLVTHGFSRRSRTS